MEPSAAQAETSRQLQDLRDRLAQGNPEHYRHWALYLQVLRQILPAAVDRCCFHLAVIAYPNRYRQMPADARAELHRRIANLVQRCCSLLTVEQLLVLAAQQHRRRQRQVQRQQRRLLLSLQRAETDNDSVMAAATNPIADPAGSVHLGLGLPISLDLQSTVEPRSGSAAAPSSRSLMRPQPTDPPMQVSDLIEAFGTMIEADEEQQTCGLLPTHPLRLLHWLEDLDGALSRRLRNLSHGLNVELVRLGLCPILAPLRLLDAVISGQLEPQNAVPNLLQLDGLSEQLGDGMGIQTLAVMLRQADLEADQPRLRSCRNRLRQARQDVRRMTQTFHRLEQRLQALDAEQLWLHDHSMARMSPDQHPTRAAEPGQGQSMNRR